MLVAAPCRSKTPVGHRLLRRRVETLETGGGFDLDALGTTEPNIQLVRRIHTNRQPKAAKA